MWFVLAPSVVSLYLGLGLQFAWHLLSYLRGACDCKGACLCCHCCCHACHSFCVFRSWACGLSWLFDSGFSSFCSSPQLGWIAYSSCSFCISCQQRFRVAAGRRRSFCCCYYYSSCCQHSCCFASAGERQGAAHPARPAAAAVSLALGWEGGMCANCTDGR